MAEIEKKQPQQAARAALTGIAAEGRTAQTAQPAPLTANLSAQQHVPAPMPAEQQAVKTQPAKQQPATTQPASPQPAMQQPTPAPTSTPPQSAQMRDGAQGAPMRAPAASATQRAAQQAATKAALQVTTQSTTQSTAPRHNVATFATAAPQAAPQQRAPQNTQQPYIAPQNAAQQVAAAQTAVAQAAASQIATAATAMPQKATTQTATRGAAAAGKPRQDRVKSNRRATETHSGGAVVLQRIRSVNKIGLFAALSAAILVGCGIAVFLLLYGFLFDKEIDVPMPNFYGKKASDIQNDTAYSGFIIEYTEKYTDEKAKGIIVGQTPRAPRKVKSNAHIVLTVSAGLQRVIVPNVAGMTRDAAKEAIKNADLNVIFKLTTDNSVTADTVLHTVPAAGENVSAGDTIAVYVSRDENVVNVTVPECVGQASLVEAIRLLGDVQLGYELAEGSTAEGAVTAQEPAANERVPRGTAVKLTLNGSAATGLDGLPQMQISGVDGHLHEYEPTSIVGSNDISIGYTIFTCKVCNYFYYGDFTQPGT